ncbi:4-alpha-glucanotransferase [Oricola thermophila]|uniref:4-alpha-glucanotransferase n=1 Tax=Oricola thermophila TaxID=2742145 RepID=A0A6N1VF78_9HYPH|nr:4-alpha-glucanotransferase [Oricola thermophila]QKV19586.1 4-alpha-glucanotransferase [Oricola thermophila]
MTGALERLAAEAGLVWRYNDGSGLRREAPPESLRAVLSALGHDAGSDAAARESLRCLREERARRRVPEWFVLSPGRAARLPLSGGGAAEWRLCCEDGEIREGRCVDVVALDPLPSGRHRLQVGNDMAMLLVAPERLAEVPRGWGVTAPLYGLKPEFGGGIGSYRDLARAATELGALGADFLGINPVHAGFPEDPLNFSPYAPSSRRHLNVGHIAVEGDGARAEHELIDYPAALAARQAALQAAWKRFRADGGDAAFETWRAERGAELARFAVHQALSEVHGAYWTDWPVDLRDPASSAVLEFARSSEDRVAFHAWLQWCAERALDAAQQAGLDAGMRHGLYLDLAVGTHPAGAETWADPALFARGVSLGSPPDAFSGEGQVWGVAPLSPPALAETGFEVLAETLREQFRFCGLLRIDHILGFERAYWCPEGLPGLYVTMPKEAMLAAARIEAARAGATIVGEDLGNIPDGLRSDLHASGILGCRVAMFERDWQGGGGFAPASSWDAQTLASFASHDLPTWRGWRKGLDIDWREKLGHLDAESAAGERGQRAADVAAFDSLVGQACDSPDAMHTFLAGAASRLVALQAEDILGIEEQANLPGTVFEHPNWRRRLTVPASDFAEDARFRRTAEIMARTGR